MQRRSFLFGLGAAFGTLVAKPALAFVKPDKPDHPLLMPYKGRSTFDAGLHYCPYVPKMEKIQVTAKSRMIKTTYYYDPS